MKERESNSIRSHVLQWISYIKACKLYCELWGIFISGCLFTSASGNITISSVRLISLTFFLPARVSMHWRGSKRNIVPMHSDLFSTSIHEHFDPGKKLRWLLHRETTNLGSKGNNFKHFALPQWSYFNFNVCLLKLNEIHKTNSTMFFVCLFVCLFVWLFVFLPFRESSHRRKVSE